MPCKCLPYEPIRLRPSGAWLVWFRKSKERLPPAPPSLASQRPFHKHHLSPTFCTILRIISPNSTLSPCPHLFTLPFCTVIGKSCFSFSRRMTRMCSINEISLSGSGRSTPLCYELYGLTVLGVVIWSIHLPYPTSSNLFPPEPPTKPFRVTCNRSPSPSISIQQVTLASS